MHNSAYWKRRFEILEEMQNQNAGKVSADISIEFKKAQYTLDNQIHTWYSRFATNNEISLADAKSWLSGASLDEFKWSVDDFIRYGKEAKLDPALMKQLENASARFHVSKLEALKLQTQMTVERLYGNTDAKVTSLFGDIYKDSYYHTAYELQKGFGIGWDFAALNNKQVETILSKPWTLDSQTFSDRLWTQKQSLLNEVHTQLTQNIILGKAPDDAIKAIAAKLNTSKHNAGRLVMTESAYFAGIAQRNAFIALDVEEYEIIETLDGETCEICGELDGQHFKMPEYQAGVTAPPFHPWCRGCTAPYFADDDGERFARDAYGKGYYVPSDMKYEDWKGAFARDAASVKDKVEYEKYKLILGKNAPETLESFVGMRYNANTWSQFKAYYNAIKTNELSPLVDFKFYQRTWHEIDEKLVGTITANGIVITGKSNHFVARTIGSITQRRSGVSVESSLAALTLPTEIRPVRVLSNGASQVFRTEEAAVSINPNSGILIQTNPMRKKKGGKL